MATGAPVSSSWMTRPGSDVWALVLYLRGTGAEDRNGAGDTSLVVVGGELCPVVEGGERSHPRPKTVSSTGPCHSWIREEMERVEDYCYTCTTDYQNL